MVDGKGKEKAKRITVAIIVLSITIFLLLQVTALSVKILFHDRLDEKEAVAPRLSFLDVAFESKDVISNINGKRVTVLNFTLQNETYYIYTEDFESKEIRNIGALEKDEEILPVVWSSKVENGTEYVINGKFVDFYEFGTGEQIPVLFVESYHEPSLLEEVSWANEFLLSQGTIGLIVLTVACILVSVFLGIVVVGEIADYVEKYYKKKIVKR